MGPMGLVESGVHHASSLLPWCLQALWALQAPETHRCSLSLPPGCLVRCYQVGEVGAGESPCYDS